MNPSQYVSSEKFGKILDNLALITDMPYKAKAFQRAASFLKSDEAPETFTVEEAKKWPGFGEGILQRASEFAKTGALKELASSNEKTSTIQLFNQIFGVGPVLAKAFYEKGYRQLKDIPENALTASQKLGLKYFSDINSRIPRAEIDLLNEKMKKTLKKFNSDNPVELKFLICGSYLRGKLTSGDVDVLLSAETSTEEVEKLGRKFIAFLTTEGLVSHILSIGHTKALCLGGACSMKRRIDFEFVQSGSWVYAQLYFTGSKEFNKRMRAIAKAKGYLLNEKGLFMAEFRIEGLETEKDVFELLEMEYLTPEER
jgi:DNA polymerase lambda